MAGDSVPTVRLPNLYPKQREVFYNPARVVVCEATTKAGKSVAGLHWLFCFCLESPEPRRCLWVSPIHPQARHMFERAERILMRADPQHRVWSSNKTERRLNVGKCHIVFAGSDEPDSLYGTDNSRVVIDEASRCKPTTWPAVRSTLTATQGLVRIIGNVKGRKNWAYAMARKAQAGEPGYAYFKLTAHDAVDGGVLTADDVEAARRDLTDSDFRELYLAEPTEDGSNPFGMQYIAAAVMPQQPEKLTACFGIDLARKQDWTVVRGVAADGTPTIFDRWQGLSWEATVDRIVGIVGTTPALADATGVGDAVVEQLNRRQPNIIGQLFTPSSKQNMMMKLAIGIQKGKCGVIDGTERSELESFEFTYTRTGGVRYSAPDGSHDDCVCGLALAWHGLDQAEHGPDVYVDFAEEAKETDTRGLVAVMNEMRKDVDWGFE